MLRDHVELLAFSSVIQFPVEQLDQDKEKSGTLQRKFKVLEERPIKVLPKKRSDSLYIYLHFFQLFLCKSYTLDRDENRSREKHSRSKMLGLISLIFEKFLSY